MDLCNKSAWQTIDFPFPFCNSSVSVPFILPADSLGFLKSTLSVFEITVTMHKDFRTTGSVNQ